MQKLLGEILLKKGLVNQAELQKALDIQQKTGKRLGQVLVEMGKIDHFQIADALAEQGQGRINLLHEEPDWELVREVDADFMIKNLIIPFSKKDKILKVVAHDPNNWPVLDKLKDFFGAARVDPFLGSKEEILQVLDKAFNFVAGIEEVVSSAEELDEEDVDLTVDDSPIVQFINELFSKAIRENVSDIHIEPQVGATRIRFRKDGDLIERATLKKSWHDQTISRIKIMAKLDISKRWEPQGGEIRFSYENRFYNMRVSTMPLVTGEKAVIRILGQGASAVKLEALGFSQNKLEEAMKVLNKKQGMILITGPTGSGKTTTLYAFLEKLNRPKINISTIEDPVEIRLPGINQTQVGKVSFAMVLRELLRQDPDVIMVGEIRDKETAEIALRAALTGHLVLSTMHTLDTVGAVNRFIDMGIEPYLVADALQLVISQRLIKTICPKCKVPDPEGLIKAQQLYPKEFAEVEQLYKGQGCSYCNYTGSKNRTSVSEIFIPTLKKRSQIANENLTAIRQEINCSKNLLDDGIAKVIAGQIAFGELLTKLGYSVEEV